MYVQKMNVKFERNRSSQYVQSLNVNHDVFRHRVTPTSERWRRDYKRQTFGSCAVLRVGRVIVPTTSRELLFKIGSNRIDTVQIESAEIYYLLEVHMEQQDALRDTTA